MEETFSGGIYGILFYYSLYSIITICVVSRYINIYRLIKSHLGEIRSEVSVVNRMILPVFILSFIEAPLNWWAQVIMAKNAGMVAISTMTAILQIRNFVIILPSYYMNTFTSFATSLNAQHNYKVYYDKFGKSIIIFFIGSLLSIVVFQIFSKLILGLYGTEYTEDSFPFFIANLSIPLLLIGNLLKIDLIPIVITIHNDRNGVPGPNQNNQQALPMLNIVFEKSLPQVIKPSK